MPYRAQAVMSLTRGSRKAMALAKPVVDFSSLM